MSPYHFVTYLLLWHQRDRNVTIFPAQNCLLFTPQVASGSASSSSLYGRDTLKCSAAPVVGMIPAEALTWAQWKRERERERESRSYYNFFNTNTSWLEVFSIRLFYTSCLYFFFKFPFSVHFTTLQLLFLCFPILSLLQTTVLKRDTSLFGLFIYSCVIPCTWHIFLAFLLLQLYFCFHQIICFLNIPLHSTLQLIPWHPNTPNM